VRAKFPLRPAFAIIHFRLIQVNTVARSLLENAVARKLSTRSFSTMPEVPQHAHIDNPPGKFMYRQEIR